ncbi:hypothetical protein C3941_23820 [Kaistia algarum]|uniref:hypothetical protein n=1 Tax=Kaistia algarum TaxID=2083279 RepID=UPI000CE79A9C|nr:hypothetical protein [Kaistia algarum]MCX5513421.1 hypothetical protein [Kaistia algarum]PPE77427.1 hypothetical protein C3941_23820 [Kaistia algarum]
MTDLVITAANVLAATGAPLESGFAGEAIVAGKAVYKAAATEKWMLADSNAATAEARQATGIALNGASANQPVSVAKSGSDITFGAVFTAGLAYYLSDTPGGICPVADIGAGEYVGLLGLAKSTTVLAFRPQYSGVAL